jgi:methylase of polypeptide subunit release factors
VDDRLPADQALSRLKRGEQLLYRGDYRNARQLLSALGRRLERSVPRPRPGASLRDRFLAERAAKGREATLLSRVLVELDDQLRLQCARAPDVAEACRAAWGAEAGARTVPLRELLGVLGSWEWQKKGIPVPALGGNIHPHYGVFGPVRQEYVELVAAAPRPDGLRVFDVGTGTGVLGILLARRGARDVVATDLETSAVACANENAARFGVQRAFRAQQADLFPGGTADLVVFNPPWLPLSPTSAIERALYDEDHALLRRFLGSVTAHLAPGGEAWLILSDLAERLGLREPGALERWWGEGELSLVARHDARPTHKRAADEGDPLHAARRAEVTTLFRLRARAS